VEEDEDDEMFEDEFQEDISNDQGRVGVERLSKQ
jgi:hypothetical protein